VVYALRSGCLLHLEASRNMVFLSSHKTGGGADMSGACDIITKVASREN
jgi:hypothetical protein